MTMQPLPTKPKAMKTKAVGAIGGGAGLGALIVWLWNTYNPDHQMPAELGAVVGSVVGQALAYLALWLPKPPASGGGS